MFFSKSYVHNEKSKKGWITICLKNFVADYKVKNMRVRENLLTILNRNIMNEFKIQFFFWIFFEAKYILLGNWIARRWSREDFYFWDFHFILNISSISNNYGFQGNKEFFVFHFFYNFLFFAKNWVKKKINFLHF